MSPDPDRDGPPTQPMALPHAEGPITLRGLPVSPGVAVGRVILFDRRSVLVSPTPIAPEAVEDEVARLDAAIRQSRARLEGLRATLDPFLDAEHRLVLDAHLLMLNDELLVTATEAEIRGGKSAAWALRHVADDLVARLARAKEPYLQERTHDIAHVAEDVLRALTGASTSLPELSEPSVLVASDLSVAELLSLPRERLLALVTEFGTATGHTAILARALHIPAIVGVRLATRRIAPRAEVIVDARRGAVSVAPTPDERVRAEAQVDRYRVFADRLRESRGAVTRLADGTRIEILANLEIDVELDEALAEHAEGVGLYRTEFLYLDGSIPDEEHLVDVFTRVGRTFAPRVVTLRTFDLGADKIPTSSTIASATKGLPLRRGGDASNPALGMRGLRLSLELEDLFRSQIRAVLRAAHDAPLRLMFPMVTTVEELRDARRVVDHARRDLARANVPHGTVPIGAMIEVPSAVMLAGALANECDFFSIGTNDLLQYALAIDRNDPAVAGLASPLTPALLRLIASTLHAAHERSLPVSLCGDMAFHPLAVPILVGMGLRSLSMPASEIPFVRALALRLDVKACEDVARRALACATEAEVRRSVVARLGETLGDLWDEHGLVL